MKTWKRREAQAAKLLGTTRRPLSGGGRSESLDDCEHPTLWIEQKHRKSHAVISIWRDAEETRQRAAKRGDGRGRTIVTLTEARRPGVFLLLRLDQFPEVAALLAVQGAPATDGTAQEV